MSEGRALLTAWGLVSGRSLLRLKSGSVGMTPRNNVSTNTPINFQLRGL